MVGWVGTLPGRVLVAIVLCMAESLAAVCISGPVVSGAAFAIALSGGALSLAALRLLRSARDVRGAKGLGDAVGLPLAGNALIARGGLGDRSSFTSGVPCSDLTLPSPLPLPLPLPSPRLDGGELPSGVPCGMKRGEEAPSAILVLLLLLGRKGGRGNREEMNKIDFANHVEGH